MRTAADFDGFYRETDPWKITRAKFRDKILRRIVSKYSSKKRVLELGCGEGHLTKEILNQADFVVGVDLSEIAISRAEKLNLPNAKFINDDFLNVSFEGYELITAIECIYYLSQEDQELFFSKITREHSGKVFIFSTPIIGKNEHRKYFTHFELIHIISRHGGSVIKLHNLNINRIGILGNLAAIIARLPLGDFILDYLPNAMIYQRCYIIRMM